MCIYDLIFSIFSPPITFAIVIIDFVIKFFKFASYRIESTKKPIGPDRILRSENDGLGDVISFQNIIQKSTKLRTKLQRCTASDDLDFFNSLHRRIIICFRISEYIARNVIAVLTSIKFPTSIRAQSSSCDIHLGTRTVVFPNGDPRHLRENLPGAVVH